MARIVAWVVAVGRLGGARLDSVRVLACPPAVAVTVVCPVVMVVVRGLWQQPPCRLNCSSRSGCCNHERQHEATHAHFVSGGDDGRGDSRWDWASRKGRLQCYEASCCTKGRLGGTASGWLLRAKGTGKGTSLKSACQREDCK
jgi:hypothetical protein